jgi:CRP-like cAMP-binding protein
MPDLRGSRISRELFLAGFGIELASVPPWVIDRITAVLEEHEFHAGDKMYRRGEAPEYLYFMREGAVRMTKEGKAPWTFQGRWLLGIHDAMSDERTRDAEALVDFTAMQVPIAGWLELLEDSPTLSRAGVLNAARTLARLEERSPSGPARPPRLVSPFFAPGAPRGPLSLVEKLAALVDLRMLRGAGVQALVDLAATSEEVSFDADQIIFPRGVERERMMLLVDGEARTDRLDPAMERRYGPGDLLGGVYSFGTMAPPWEARATAPGRGVAFRIESWFDLMEEHFDLVRSTFSALSARREMLLEHLAEASGGLVLT